MAGFCSEKLVHPLPEVRRRALQSLDFKVKHALLSQQDFLQDRAILTNLLGLLKFDSNGAQVDASALLLLQRVASSFPLAARQLLQLGTEDSLRLLRPKRTPDLHPLIDSALSQLAPMAPGDKALYLGSIAQDTQGVPYGSGNHKVGAHAFDMGYRLDPQTGHAAGTPFQQFGSTVLLPPHTISRPLEPEFRSAATPFDPPDAHTLPALPSSPPDTSSPPGTSLSSRQPLSTPPYPHSHLASSSYPAPHPPQHPFPLTPSSHFTGVPSGSVDLSAVPSTVVSGVMDTANATEPMGMHATGSMGMNGAWGSGSGWAEATSHPAPSRTSGGRALLLGPPAPTPGSVDAVHRHRHHHHHHHHHHHQQQQQRERQQQILQQYYSPQKQQELIQRERQQQILQQHYSPQNQHGQPEDVQAAVRRIRAERGVADMYCCSRMPLCVISVSHCAGDVSMALSVPRQADAHLQHLHSLPSPSLPKLYLCVLSSLR
ncbi:hypothetical protein DUNSADRAFT_9819 [Dunaliella salina]|uniref:Rotatin N-terminal domain-containing protein n=1 Tax=Dunaliella salina TaxID=3046 RepID=A0ABQ7GGM0_DUNSA|nr:hypothetical protein DUNSADRAFT_9819 [Dunaliella salina]|eukprot:KAF5833752.1 hypothetical protein DUNSADRAFT_9819 [Dunaliella salina]